MDVNSAADQEIPVARRIKHSVVEWLENETARLLTEIQSQECWSEIMSPDTDASFVKTVMREIYTEIVGYQPQVIEAAIAVIAQMPRSMNPRLVRSMLAHQTDEFDHGEMAFRDLMGLGIAKGEVPQRRISPEAFAVAGVWWTIVQARNPFAYLGALFLFEGLTPSVTQMVKGRLISKGFTTASLSYIDFHSTEDMKHANLVRYLITEIASTYPESVSAIKHGFQCFRAVYPIPLWRAAFQRARCSYAAGLTQPVLAD